MTEFNVSQMSLDDDEAREEMHDEIREWAEQKNYAVFEKEGHDGQPITEFKVGEFRTVIVDPYGNVTIQKFANLGGDGGSLKLTENSLIVEDDRGQRSIVSHRSFPIHKS